MLIHAIRYYGKTCKRDYGNILIIITVKFKGNTGSYKIN